MTLKSRVLALFSLILLMVGSALAKDTGYVFVSSEKDNAVTVLDGKTYRLCLTLGALAELEHAFGEDDMLAVAERFEAGRIAATDAIKMIGAGLRGAGYDIGDAAVGTMRAPGGAAGFVDIVARLLAATFTAARDGSLPEHTETSVPLDIEAA